MRVIVFPDAEGIISFAGVIRGQPLPDNAALVEVETLDLPPMTAAVLTPDRTVTIVENWIGSGPWFDQAAPAPPDHRLSVQTVKASALPEAALDRLTAIEIDTLGVNPEARGWRMEPRAETPAERRARERRDAAAQAANEAERRANRVVSAVQIRLAANELGLRAGIEALVADPATPQAFRDYWEYATELRRQSPLWPQALALIGKTEADLDQLFDVAEGK